MNRKRLRELADVIEGMPYMEVPEEMISAPLDEFPYPAHGRVCKLNAFNMNLLGVKSGQVPHSGLRGRLGRVHLRRRTELENERKPH